MEQVRSINLDKVSCGGSAVGMFGSEFASNCFARLQKMRDAVAPDYRRIVDAILLFDRDVEEVGRAETEYNAETQCRAVALYVLRRGLEAIAVSLGLLEREPLPDGVKVAAE